MGKFLTALLTHKKMLISFICLVTLCPSNCDRLAVSMTAMCKCAHRGFVVSTVVSSFSAHTSLLSHFLTPVCSPLSGLLSHRAGISCKCPLDVGFASQQSSLTASWTSRTLWYSPSFCICLAVCATRPPFLTAILHVFCKHLLVLCSNNRSVSGKHPGGNGVFMMWRNCVSQRCVVSDCLSMAMAGMPACMPRDPSASPSVATHFTLTLSLARLKPISLPIRYSEIGSTTAMVAVQPSCPGQLTS